VKPHLDALGTHQIEQCRGLKPLAAELAAEPRQDGLDALIDPASIQIEVGADFVGGAAGTKAQDEDSQVVTGKVAESFVEFLLKFSAQRPSFVSA
jgi:hypothetical protein